MENPLWDYDYVDLSTASSQAEVITPEHNRDHECKIQDLLQSLQMALHAKEVVVAWRGRIPRGVFEVVDPITGDFLRMLHEEVP